MRSARGFSFGALMGNMLPIAFAGVLDSVKDNSAVEIARLNYLGRINSTSMGPGRVTVMTHDNYIHDHRRKDWGKVRAGRRPGDGLG